MLRTFVKSSVILGLLGTGGLAAQAETEFSGNVTLTSDYVWRGVTQSDQSFAIQGGFDVAHSTGFYAGTWASNVDFGDNTNLELDLYGGYAGEFGDGFSYDVGVIQYLYSGQPSTTDYDFLEVYAGLSYAFDAGIELGGFVAFDPDNENLYTEGTAGYSVNDELGVSLAIGYFSFDGGFDYTQTTIGASYTVGELFDVGASIYSVDVDGVDTGIALSISKSL